jgi:hypothetical protein
VKWKNLDYTSTTWEHSDFIIKYYNHLRIEYIKLIETEKILNLSIEERLELIKGKD